MVSMGLWSGDQKYFDVMCGYEPGVGDTVVCGYEWKEDKIIFMINDRVAVIEQVGENTDKYFGQGFYSEGDAAVVHASDVPVSMSYPATPATLIFNNWTDNGAWAGLPPVSYGESWYEFRVASVTYQDAAENVPEQVTVLYDAVVTQ